MRKIDFAIQIVSWISRQEDFSPIHAVCLMAVSGNRTTPKDIHEKIEGFSKESIAEAIIDLNEAGYLTCDVTKNMFVGHDKNPNRLTPKGEEVVLKLLNPKQDAA
jgi:DNA-binding PadR family transcriptional regulator